jgi:MbtH protein
MLPKPPPHRHFKVLINDAKQYLVWPEHRLNPPGWQDTGQTGTQAECLAYIDRAWTHGRMLGSSDDSG